MTSGSGVLAGVDVGTTNCKVGVFAPDGSAVAVRCRPTSSDAFALVAGVLEDLRRCLDGRRPLAVGITGVAEGGVALDADLRPMGPLFWWHDRRPAGAARRLAQQCGRAELFHRTGVDISAKTPLALWCWLGDLNRIRVWVGVAELVTTALCGKPLTDRTLPGRTGAFDQRAGRYDEDLLALAGIRPEQLPEPRGVGAARCVLRTGTPVVVAGHDHLVAAYAAGAREPGQVADSLGTAEAVVTITRTPPTDDAAGTGISWNRTADGEHWALVSGYPGAGRLVEWLRARCGGDFGALDALAENVERPTGVVVLPYLDGRAAPAPDAGRGMSVRGLTAAHGMPDLVVAVFEGAACHGRWMAEVQARHADTVLGAVTAFGGPSRSRAWMSLKAHVLPGPVRRLRTADAACLGAAALAGRAVGVGMPVATSEELPRGDALAERYEIMYRDFLSHAREAA
ncbi:MAG TPA: FGGY-family carbohydrate kinase [Actinophytocola sp.]|nr:FGGY-family carbohydrate kinase [Actinophytocola sp.]